MDDPDASFADRLRSAREQAGFTTAAEASRAFGWPEATYRHHENGTRGFTIKQALAYGKAFKVSPAWLVGWVAKSERALVEDYRDNLLGIDKLRSGGEIARELADRFRIVFVSRVLLSQLADAKAALPLNPDAFYLLDREIVEAVRVKNRQFLLAVDVDEVVPSTEYSRGDIVLVDRDAQKLGQQDQRWVYTYNGIAGISRLWAHADGTFEVRDSIAGAPAPKMPAADVNLWGRVAWHASGR